MKSIDDASVFQLSYDLLKEIHAIRKTFDKTEKYSLGTLLEDSILHVLLAIIEAGHAKADAKIRSIDHAQRQLEKSKVLLRLAGDLKQIGERRALAMQSTMQTIGRMLGGWKRSI